MATYRAPGGHEFAKPIPLHALSAEALEAVESVRAHGAERRLGRIVAKHGNPRPPEWRGDPVTRNAHSLHLRAVAAGFEVQTLVGGARCTVEGYRLTPERAGFRATWLRAVALAFVWCEPWRFEEVPDARPVAADARTHVGKAGYRSPGMGTTRLSQVGSPWGVKVTYTDLVGRVEAYTAAKAGAAEGVRTRKLGYYVPHADR